ncbi:MAG TPA: sigma-70 family RNA polymerase sigma factor [Gemmataceae bacterium]|nr:sigma-70 family RNA polymerase sigma factor [Gemmataceae bacterium]
MDDGASSKTRISLLSRLRHDPNDPSAWDEFVARYSTRIQSWCRVWGLQDADVQDVTQTVLVQLAAKLRGFVYDPAQSFRGWLKTLTRHAWCDFVTDRQRAVPGSGGSGMFEVLHAIEARDDLERRMEEAFDLELLELASNRVRERVEPHTWEAFQLTAVEGLSGADAAHRLGIPVASVFKAKSNVQKMLQHEIALLERLEAV